MNKLLFLIAFWISSVDSYSIVFLHIGRSAPTYLPWSISQARRFNPDCEIYFLCNSIAARPYLQCLKENRVTRISLDSLKQSPDHQRFLRESKHNRHSMNGYWLYTCERFFYLEEFFREYNLTDVFHLENDMMIYADLGEFLPTLHKHYAKKVGATFEFDDHCVPGLMYVSEAEPFTEFTRFFADVVKQNRIITDMIALARFRNEGGESHIAGLPVLMPSFCDSRPLQRRVKDLSLYTGHYEEFDSIFDGMTIGQYLGGVHPVNESPSRPGYINPLNCFNISYFDFTWEEDALGRRIPYILFENQKKRINNIHVLSKELWKFQ